MRRAAAAVISLISVIIGLGLLLKFVVPLFANLFVGFGVPLPAPTTMLWIATFLFLGIGFGLLALRRSR